MNHELSDHYKKMNQVVGWVFAGLLVVAFTLLIIAIGDSTFYGLIGMLIMGYVLGLVVGWHCWMSRIVTNTEQNIEEYENTNS